MLQFAGADRLLISKEIAYIHQQGKLKSLNRVKYGLATTAIVSNNKNIKSMSDRLGKIKGALKKATASKDNTKIIQLKSQITGIEKSISEFKTLNIKSKNDLVKSNLWQADAPAPYDLILAGRVIFMGAKDKVLGYDARTGKEIWSAKVKGKTYGLAFSGGRLIASTTLGHIYCFSGPSS